MVNGGMLCRRLVPSLWSGLYLNHMHSLPGTGNKTPRF
jgi:hypothetical protein